MNNPACNARIPTKELTPTPEGLNVMAHNKHNSPQSITYEKKARRVLIWIDLLMTICIQPLRGCSFPVFMSSPDCIGGYVHLSPPGLFRHLLHKLFLLLKKLLSLVYEFKARRG